MRAIVEPVSAGNRRIDRVLDPAFADGLDRLDLPVLRARRADAEAEETELAYLRRLLQGRVDILRAELARRAAGAGPSLAGELLAGRPASRADEPSPSRPFGAVPRLLVPERAEHQRRRVEALLADADLARTETLSDAELAAAADRLAAEETRVSAVRRDLHRVLDRFRAELTRRYRDGDANVDDLLRQESPGAPGPPDPA